MLRTSAVLAAAAFLTTGSAMAQTSPPSAGSKEAIPEKQAAPLQSGRSDDLSHKLSQTGGVIHPNTNVDPDIHVPAPEPHPNSTPVIPPSATGGNTAK